MKRTAWHVEQKKEDEDFENRLSPSYLYIPPLLVFSP